MLVVVVALALRLGVLNDLETRVTYVTFFPAVLIAAVVGGVPAGVLAAALSAVSAAVWVAPVQVFADWLALGVFCFGAALVVATAEGLHRAWGRVIEAEAQVRHADAQTQMADALHASEERQRLALDASAAGTWAWNVSSDLVTADETYRDIYGFGEDQTIGLAAWADRIHAEDRERMTHHAEKCASGGSSEWHEEFRIDHPGRGVRWLACRGRAMRNSDGRVTHLIGIILDVTERKLTEERLRANEAKLQTIIENMTEGLVVCDLDGNLQHFNRTALEVHGFTRVEEVLRPLPEFEQMLEFRTTDGTVLPPDQWPLTRILRGERLWNVDLQVRRLDIDWERICSYGGVLMCDAQVAVLTVSDITARRKAEEALRHTTELLNQGVRVARLGIFEHDHDASTIHFSPEMRAIYGWNAQKAVTLPLILEHVHPEDRAAIAAEIQRAHDPLGDGEYEVEHQIVHSDGTVRWVASRARTFFEGEGSARRPVRTVGAKLDITERKRDEERLRTLTRELDHRVKNSLARFAVVVQRTRACASTMAEYIAALEGRIQSMARTQSLLSRSQWGGVGLMEILWDELAPYVSDQNVNVGGLDLLLNPEAAQALTMVIHELVTNAAKYGALSSPRGQVTVAVALATEGPANGKAITILWVETGGPKVSKPQADGYGSHVIRELLGYELGGQVELAFDANGVRCNIRLPLARVKVEAAPS